MSPFDPDTVRAAILAAAIAIIATVLFDAASAHAQGCVCVTDPPVELSLNTGGGGGLWRAQAGYLTTLTQNLSLGIFDPQKFAASFPGWLALPPTSTQTAKQVSALSLTTYAGGVAIAQQQAANFGNEDTQLAAIEARSTSSTAVLQAIQANTEAVLAVAQQIQALRQLALTLLDIDAVQYGEELNERSRAEATTAKSLNLGVEP